jgi:hypothetical protein
MDYSLPARIGPAQILDRCPQEDTLGRVSVTPSAVMNRVQTTFAMAVVLA